ncbi:MAG: hypothetical protein ABIO94_05445 [Opitutaceae bacterium]
MKFSVTIARDENGVWVAECPSIPGGVSQGRTKTEAQRNIREAIKLCLKVRADIHRRMEEIRSGKEKGVPGEVVSARIRKIFGAVKRHCGDHESDANISAG